MHQKNLNALSLMAVESELVQQTDFDNIILHFSSSKTGKKPIALKVSNDILITFLVT